MISDDLDNYDNYDFDNSDNSDNSDNLNNKNNGNICDIYDLDNFNNSYDYKENLKIIEIYGKNKSYDIFINKNKINFNKSLSGYEVLSFEYIFKNILKTNKYTYTFMLNTNTNNSFYLNNTIGYEYQIFNNLSLCMNLYNYRLYHHNNYNINDYYIIIKFYNVFNNIYNSDYLTFYNYGDYILYNTKYNRHQGYGLDYVKYLVFNKYINNTNNNDIFEIVHTKLNNNLINIQLNSPKNTNMICTSIINILPVTDILYIIIITPLKITDYNNIQSLFLFNKNNNKNNNKICKKCKNNKNIPYYSKNIYLCDKHIRKIQCKLENFLEEDLYNIKISEIIKNINYTYNTNINLEYFQICAYE
jgi:hypothetical protein